MSDKHADWWATWWKRDYSWEGLGALNEDGTPKRPWEGWIVLADGTLAEDPAPQRYTGWKSFIAELPDGARLATLQDYWRDQENELIPDPTSPKDEKGEHSRHFTRFHLPLHWQDGAPTGKADWGGAECKALNDLLGKKIEGSAETAFVGLGELNGPDRRVQFQGGVFLDFNAADFMSSPAKPDAEPATSPLNWRSDFAFFSGNAGFNSATFSGNAGFNIATFSGDAGFNSATFSRDARFESATFSGDAGFESATFFGDAVFDSATFSGNARFNSATFSGNARFNSAIFTGDVSFQGDGASFSVEPFQLLPIARPDKEKAKSDDVAFADKFERVIEDGSNATRAFKYASFEDCVFLGDVNFNNRDFTEATSFRRSEFWRLASFHGSRLHQGVSFYNAIFRYAIHRDRQCVRCGPKSGGRDWPQVREDVTLRLWKAKRRADRLRLETALAPLQNQDFVTIDEATQYGWRSYRAWLVEFAFKRTDEAEEFGKLHKSKYDARENEGFLVKLESQLLNFIRLKKHKPEPVEGDTQEDYFEELEGCYRTLKLAMEDKRDRVEEGKFFSLEIKTRRRRRRPNVLYWERLMSDLYGGTSEYGNSVVLPVAWILSFMLVFGVLYAVQGSSSLLGWDWKVPNFAELGQGFSYSAGRVFGFGPWSSEPEACTMMGQLLNVQPEKDVICADGHNGWGVWTAFGIKALATVQTLMAIILVFLSGLAVRRRFQIN